MVYIIPNNIQGNGSICRSTMRADVLIRPLTRFAMAENPGGFWPPGS